MDLRARSTVALLLAGEVSLLLAAPSVEASDVTESVSIAPTTSLGLDQTVTIPKFDSSLGTLESVSVSLTGTGDFVQKFEDLGSGGQVKLTQNLQMLLGFAGQSYIPRFRPRLRWCNRNTIPPLLMVCSTLRRLPAETALIR